MGTLVKVEMIKGVMSAGLLFSAVKFACRDLVLQSAALSTSIPVSSGPTLVLLFLSSGNQGTALVMRHRYYCCTFSNPSL